MLTSRSARPRRHRLPHLPPHLPLSAPRTAVLFSLSHLHRHDATSRFATLGTLLNAAASPTFGDLISIYGYLSPLLRIIQTPSGLDPSAPKVSAHGTSAALRDSARGIRAISARYRACLAPYCGRSRWGGRGASTASAQARGAACTRNSRFYHHLSAFNAFTVSLRPT